MTPVSLMPPVDYCPSCEGRKAEGKAFELGEARAKQAELQSAAGPAAGPSPGAPSAIEAAGRSVANEVAQPVPGAVQPLLAPDLAVQASLARPAIDAANSGVGNGEAAALRLRSTQAYQAL
ncbi:MAG: hypothetical protein ACR2RA_03770 [Geminicoccaceae bacterium]